MKFTIKCNKDKIWEIDINLFKHFGPHIWIPSTFQMAKWTPQHYYSKSTKRKLKFNNYDYLCTKTWKVSKSRVWTMNEMDRRRCMGPCSIHPLNKKVHALAFNYCLALSHVSSADTWQWLWQLLETYVTPSRTHLESWTVLN